MSTNSPALEDLRAEIDRIDDQIHDLLMQRALVAESVRTLKEDERVKIRPGREATMLYRLAARHSGAFPKQAMLRIWREIISGTLAIEGPFFVAVQTPGNSNGYMDLARDHYGTFTYLNRHESSAAVIDAVDQGDASVGILPFPQRDATDSWWRYLASSGAQAPKVIARLPFIGETNALGANLDALVISTAQPAETGRDVSLFKFDVTGPMSSARIQSAFAEVGLDTGLMFDWVLPGGADLRQFLVEVGGFVTTEHPAIKAIAENLNGDIGYFVWLGAYAIPMDDEELGVGNDERKATDRRNESRDTASRRLWNRGRKSRGTGVIAPPESPTP